MATLLQINNLRTLRSCKLCVICAKSDEAEVVKDRWAIRTRIAGADVAELPKAFASHDFYTSTFELDEANEKNDRKLSYYLTYTSRQGIQSFAAEAASLFTVLKPTYAVMVGCCAALKGRDYQLEDVVFGEKAINYEEGKWSLDPETKKPVFAADVKTVDAQSSSMGGFLQKYHHRTEWKHGDYISGCSVRLDADAVFKSVRSYLRNAGALEMEASAFLQVCQVTGVHAFGVIKGVSDLGDEHKGVGHNNHYRPSLKNAADATKSFVEYKLARLPPGDANIDGEPGAVVVDGYHTNFISVLVGKLLRLKKTVEVNDNAVKIVGIRVVLPRDYDAIQYDYSAVEKIQQNFELTEVSLAGGARTTPAWVKGQYIFDFPTTIGSSLRNHPNQPEQIKFFKTKLATLLRKGNDDAFVKILEWPEFEALSSQIDAQTPVHSIVLKDSATVKSPGAEAPTTNNVVKEAGSEAPDASQDWVKLEG
ncbi:uncharacterized protein AB675_1807 [Cyphellophora attinorum]|uniref:Nucleoside phosphorylase domain-containing protein n=1 Tax=Cyphellophora attinorum TaxID=1664694 RepID=A0A0N1HUM0_9EURO|nr:uncharacterized protein AB675_1807 [Phialophora attinorum]KPI43114.1 hypothetical protein AB675_1807 [Phialophora attinorum]